ncbi:MAG: hypothetical protein A2Y18_00275 [Clostridiales bacterium GWD2_32_19]|nr:MAG: hypothetical protein A2Y18_00275 [Clostridiales bacterium GWD2_32_19]
MVEIGLVEIGLVEIGLKRVTSAILVAVMLLSCVNITKVQAISQEEENIMLSPIKKAYAGAEYALFLHEDTSVSGFGSNVNNVLGMTNGEDNNTAGIVQVSGPTGIKYIKAGKYNATAFKPTEDDPNLYDWIYVNQNLKTMTPSKIISIPVKDADWSGRSAPGVNHHDTYAYIDENNKVLSSGSDYWTHTGVGPGWPYSRYVYGIWNPVIQPSVDQAVLLNTLSNEDNTTSNLTVVTEAFISTVDNITLDFKYRSMVPNAQGLTYENTLVKLEVIDVNNGDNVVYTSPRQPYYVHNPNYSAYSNLAANGIGPGTYKVRITSSNTKWDLKVLERRNFVTGEKTLITSGNTGRSSIIDVSGNIYAHDYGWGYYKKVSDTTLVDIDSNTVESGSSGYVGIDKSGQVWTWSTSAPVNVTFPSVSGVPFYDNNKVKEVSTGNGFYMAISENINTNETNVWVWGDNSYGKLGLGQVGTTLEYKEINSSGVEETISVDVLSTMLQPVRVARKGEILKNIQSVAAGDQFSVIVQNTEEGQLVWTAGHNGKGQLGGGVEVAIKEPILVPGIRGIKKAFMFDSPEVVLQSDDNLYSFGGITTYPKVITSPLPGQKLINEWSQGNAAYGLRQSVLSSGVSEILLSEGDNVPYGHGSTYKQGRGSEGEWTAIRVNDSIKHFNHSQKYFEEVKDVASTAYAGILIDDKGRMWGWGTKERAGAGTQDQIYTVEGYYIPWAHPTQISEGAYAEPIFTQVAGSNGPGYALDKHGKLWIVTTYVTHLSTALAINEVNIVKLYGGNEYGFSAIDENGDLWIWANGGTPTKIDRAKHGNQNVVQAANGYDHRLYVTEDGSVWAMGNNAYGKLGDGTDINSNDPVKVLNITDAVYVAASKYNSIAVNRDGTVWAWGFAAYGSIGNNFTLERGTISTAVGNDLPEMTIQNELKTTYYSRNSIYEDNKNIKIYGTIREPEFEPTTIKVGVLGLENKVEVLSFESDIYDRAVTQNWTATFNILDIDETLKFQSLTKIQAEDTRGGIIEQFFAGNLIIDNQAPEIPTWGDVYEVDGETATQLIQDEDGKYKSLDNSIRMYLNIQQKTGDNKAPVKSQYQLRKKEAWGYMPWSEDPATWVTTGDDYVEFFSGFEGEWQVRIRAVDEAGNISNIVDETKKFIINDAGPVIQDLKGETFSEENVLRNEVTFYTESNSERVSYTVSRCGERETTWADLTTIPIPLTYGKMTFNDTDVSLKGNETYKYIIKGENIVTTGKSEEIDIITYPYAPKSMTTSIAESKDGLNILVDQDLRNVGNIKYRLVIQETDRPENFHLVDIESSNNLQTLIYQVRQEDVKFPIINNPIDVKLLYKGYNDIWLEKKYDESEVVKPIYSADDKIGPTVSVKINNGTTRMAENETNKVNVQVVAVDDHTPIDEVQIQFSTDGKRWVGQHKEDGEYVEDVFSKYSMQYENFELGQGSGRKILYVRAKDQTGNYGYAFAEVYVIGINNVEIYQPTVNEGIGLTNPGEIGGGTKTEEGVTIEIETGNVYGEEFIYLKASQVQVKVSDYFTINQSEEVQYSTDGVEWSEWEPGVYFVNKELMLGNNDGLKAIFIRQRNIEERISNVAKVKFMLDTTPPEINIKSGNLSYIAVGGEIGLELEIKDNMLKDIPFSVKIEKYVDGGYSTLLNASGSTGGEMITKINLTALPVGRIKITVTATDGSDNITRINKILWSK